MSIFDQLLTAATGAVLRYNALYHEKGTPAKLGGFSESAFSCPISQYFSTTQTSNGQAIGLIQNKKMVCITSRGSDYSEGMPYHSYDFQEPYLRAIFGFIGISDIHFINTQPMDWGQELRVAATAAGNEEARKMAANWDMSAVTAPVANPPGLKSTAP